MSTLKQIKPMSCGIVVRCKGKVLLCRATKFWDEQGREVWGLPKGVRDEGETPAQAACRECYEETGLVFEENDVEFLAFYTTKRREYSFFTVDVEEVNIDSLKCITMVDEDERNYPEVDAYVMADAKEYGDLVYNSQMKLLDNKLTAGLMFNQA